MPAKYEVLIKRSAEKDLKQLNLKYIVGREVDLVEKAAIRNPFRKKNIYENMKVLYAA
ncbi:hypothetical protein HY768_04665 [candidate division TA06 bacterium]|uniref:Uncharacterized protein n=1 Tax=candidate division TA06 bacterium TaxID=2250710 RepID=A0A933I8K0_UNCT6|nr:hypothetical protein [candidate division TA06 bacterium]